MRSPFKFLDSYGPEDINAFFGRERETQELYSLVTKNRLTFVYGPSGSGKTSLVQCGLSNRFRGVDWLPLFIRRGEDMNDALAEAISKALGLAENLAVDQLETGIHSLFNKYLRPVYLIFDQFEELFILGDRDAQKERAPFYQVIADLLDAEIPCRMIFIMREDYFGHLDQFERLIPELYHRKLRVESMSRENLRKVIVGSCEVYDIPFGNSRQDPDLILENLLAEKLAVQMPFVQVYLHKLYNKAAALSPAQPRFDAALIEQMGPMDQVLGFFLEDQEQTILQELATFEPPATVVRQVLDVFVSEEGTKVPLPFTTDEKGLLHLKGKAAERLAHLPPALISACLESLEQNRILRRSEDQLEVAHDTLAALIDQQRTNEQRQLNEVRRRIEIGYQEHVDAKGQYFFNRGQISRITPFLDQLALPPEWKQFLEASETNSRAIAEKEKQELEEKLALEQAAQEAKAQQLAQAEANLEAAQKARTRQRMLTTIVGVIAGIAIIAGTLAFRSSQEANAQRTEAEKQTQEAKLALCAAQREQLQRRQLQLQQARQNRLTYANAGETLYAQAQQDSITKYETDIQNLQTELNACE